MNGSVAPVLLIGGGPSAAAMAISLCQMGVRCVVLAGSQKAQTYIESLAPNAKTQLTYLHANCILNSKDHAPQNGHVCYWGSDKLAKRHFISEPYGNGWYIDRISFDKSLRSIAENLGCVWKEHSSFFNLEFRNGIWHCTFRNGRGEIELVKSNFLVDASGRRSIVARYLGVRRVTVDKLVSFATETNHCRSWPFPTHSYVESVEDGWWFVVEAQNKRMTVMFMSDLDVQLDYQLLTAEVFFQKLLKTQQLKNFFDSPLSGKVTCRPASTSFLDRITGLQWLAIGDAAVTYDPLSSYGIVSAMGSGIYGSMAVRDSLSGNKSALSSYEFLQQKTFIRTYNMTINQYRQEKRWCNHEFWRRRQFTK